MLLNHAKSEAECDAALKSALQVPANEANAATQLRAFFDYVLRVGEDFVAAGGDARSKPRAISVPFFVSYFWQIQQRDIWPVYYTNSVQELVT